jgi:hypothetical protein
MKKKPLARKITLTKKTISYLNNNDVKHVQGGDTRDCTTMADSDCPGTSMKDTICCGKSIDPLLCPSKACTTVPYTMTSCKNCN